jgi:hypothetical protein
MPSRESPRSAWGARQRADRRSQSTTTIPPRHPKGNGTSLLAQQRAFDRQNALAARIILADIERYGGGGSLAVGWARTWCERHEPQLKLFPEAA